MPFARPDSWKTRGIDGYARVGSRSDQRGCESNEIAFIRLANPFGHESHFTNVQVDHIRSGEPGPTNHIGTGFFLL